MQLFYKNIYTQSHTITLSTRDPWMSPLLKYLIRKRSKAELTEQIYGIISHNRTKMAKSECIGTSQWWKNVDILSHRRNRAHIVLDNEFKENLNDYFGELCGIETMNSQR